MEKNMKVAVGIPTTGRREQMSLTVAQIAKQHIAPCRLVVCPADAEDYDHGASKLAGCAVQIVEAQRGSCSQRNAILDVCHDLDLIVFLDDDFYMAPDYIENVIALFESCPDVVVATGVLFADGALGPGIEHHQAIELIRKGGDKSPSSEIRDVHNAYGCNLVVRLEAVRTGIVRFDERLPLYGWLEDVDFSRRLAPYGKIIKSHALRGVHLATKRGKTSGVRFGYSQVANPLYILSKGSVSRRFAYCQLGRNVASNIVKIFKPEPWVDRRGRLKGNIMAWFDLVRGRLDPARIRKIV